MKPKFPSIDLTVDAARHIYDLEDARHDGIQQKAATATGSAGLIAAILGLGTQFDEWQTLTLVAIFLLAMAPGIVVLCVRTFRMPHGEPEHFYALAKRTHDDLLDQFLRDLIVSIEENRKRNNRKLNWLRASIVLLALGLSAVCVFLLVRILT